MLIHLEILMNVNWGAVGCAKQQISFALIR